MLTMDLLKNIRVLIVVFQLWNFHLKFPKIKKKMEKEERARLGGSSRVVSLWPKGLKLHLQ